MINPLYNAEYVFRAQRGPQTAFLKADADIVIYGGAAGGGKTYGALLAALRHHQTPNARVGIFRRDRGRLTNPGGLWDEADKIYPYFGGMSNQQTLTYKFPQGARISMHGLQYEADVKKHHGSQYSVMIFDELTEFTEYQFFYMMSRNRSDAGIASYIRATCNPDSTSWVRTFIDWWIGGDGLPIPARSGKVRWFARINDSLHWADSQYDLMRDYNLQEHDCKSVTFIPATIEDNQILLQNDPRYISNLRALPEVQKQQLLYGNWNVKADGKVFKQADFKNYIRIPPSYLFKVIVVDTAQKTKESSDYTVIQAWIKVEGSIYLVDQVRGKYEYPDLKRMFIAFATKHLDARNIYIEDAVSGTALIQECSREPGLQGRIKPITRSKDKYTRAYDAQGYVKSGYVFINPMSDYYTDYISEMTAFSGDNSHAHDDQVDCTCDAIQKMLVENTMTQPQKNIQLSSKVY